MTDPNEPRRPDPRDGRAAEPPERGTADRPAADRPADLRDDPAPVRRRPRPATDGSGSSGGRVGEDEYVRLPRATRGGPRLLAVFAGLVVVVAAIVIAGVIWGTRQIDPSGDQGAIVADVIVPTGSSTDAIAKLLEDAGVVSNARLFRWYTSWKSAGPWDAGRYVKFRENSSFDEAIEVLDDGPVPVDAVSVRIPEGRRLADALGDINKAFPDISVAELQSTLDSGAVTSKYKPEEVRNWEGFLFPDTYEFLDDATAQEILQAMATKMDEVLDGLGYDKAETLQGRTAFELVTIASLIERETGQPAEERGKIARVIMNRLDAGEPLGIDAANLYGLGRTSGALTKSDLDSDSPYNVRKFKGLPPTPIALPGRASLQAAIQPAEGPWKYYVLTTKDPPTHLFTDSYKEFQRAKADAQARGVF